MKRKKFVKQAMANGWDRNEANEWAEKARACGIKYENYWPIKPDPKPEKSLYMAYIKSKIPGQVLILEVEL